MKPTPDDIPATVKALGRLPVPELKQRYAEVFGEPTRTNHTQYLATRIVWRKQALREGGLSERARRAGFEPVGPGERDTVDADASCGFHPGRAKKSSLSRNPATPRSIYYAWHSLCGDVPPATPEREGGRAPSDVFSPPARAGWCVSAPPRPAAPLAKGHSHEG